MRKAIEENENIMKEMEIEISEKRKSIKPTDQNNKQLNLPNRYQTIDFIESSTGYVLRGKILTKHKKNSIQKNVLGIKLEDGTEKDYDFLNDVDSWKDAR